MKIAVFDTNRIGLIEGAEIVDVTDVLVGLPHVDVQDLVVGLIANYDDLKERLAKHAAAGSTRLALDDVRLSAPLPRPHNIVCMAVNYMEDGTLTEKPTINAFHKASTSVIGPGGTMVLPDVAGDIFEGEAELAVVMGKRATRVSRADAYDHIFGYTCLIDGSVRGLPPSTNTFFQMKSRDSFCAIGPWIVTADEVPNPQELRIQLTNNGEVMQSFNTNDMAHPIDRCIEWITSIHTLQPGDVLSTGTNHRGLHPFMDGDKIVLTVERIGELPISVRDDLRRTWQRKTRLQHVSEGGTGPYTPQIGGRYAKQNVSA